MPKLSDSVADAVIVRWLKAPGDSFARGDALIEVETDKATVVYEAEADGRLGSILVPEGSSVAVGAPIATLGNGELAVSDPGALTERPPEPDGRSNATPVARRKAVELGVALHGITGTGPGGRITREDVERAVGNEASPAPASGKGDVRVVELNATQATIARRMVESATTIPVFTVSADIDMSLIAALRKDVDGAPSINDFAVKSAAMTLRDFPRFNADDDIKKLIQERSRVSDLLGMFNVRSFTAIIDPPQVAILAVGGLRGDAMTVTLTCDHRVVYGAHGARFLSHLRELLERPLALVT